MQKTENKIEEDIPAEALKMLEKSGEWSFDVFALSDACNNQPLSHLTKYIFRRYEIPYTFKIDNKILQNFLVRIEEGYCRYNASYHNTLHAADVTHSMYYMISKTGLKNWLTNLEIFACLLAAVIHDYEHNGTTNNFQVATRSERALIYNDRSVHENHHISAAFFVMKDVNSNILSNLTRQQYRAFRRQIIDMVLATDMVFHFQMLRTAKSNISSSTVDKTKILSYVMHTCDISHAAKPWSIHNRFVTMINDELAKQGELERKMGLSDPSKSDNKQISVPEFEIQFIDFFVDPTVGFCGDLLESVLEPIAGACKDANAALDDPTSEEAVKKMFRIRKPWVAYINENKKNWMALREKDRCSLGNRRGSF